MGMSRVVPVCLWTALRSRKATCCATPPTCAGWQGYERSRSSTHRHAGVGQWTSDPSSVIEEIVDRNGWVDVTPWVIIITGSGTRVAESYNGDDAAAPLLHVEYTTP